MFKCTKSKCILVFVVTTNINHNKTCTSSMIESLKRISAQLTFNVIRSCSELG